MKWLATRTDDDAVVIVEGEKRWSSAELRAAGERWREAAPLGTRSNVRTRSTAELAAALIGLQGWAGAVELLSVTGAVSEREAAAQGDWNVAAASQSGGAATSFDTLTAAASPGADAAAASDPGASPAPPLDTRWVLFTSGTTGEPKPIVHTFASLTRTVRPDREHSRTWGLLYEPQRMAGIQVIAQVLLGGGRLVVPQYGLDLSAKVQFFKTHGVDSLSATPSMWRRILQAPEAAHWPLRQITLGGEIADQRVLDALAQAFPGARITHVFAATETGAAFSVNDGREGFPVAFLEQPPGGVRLEIREGVLHVHSPQVQGAASDGFVSTGDVVEVHEDRVLFKGRDSGVANVAGAKVFPEQVESLLRTHPGVADAVVQAVPNTFSGSILVARVLPTAQVEPRFDKQLRGWLRSQAPSHWVPARITIVEDLATSANGKAVRS